MLSVKRFGPFHAFARIVECGFLMREVPKRAPADPAPFVLPLRQVVRLGESIDGGVDPGLPGLELQR